MSGFDWADRRVLLTGGTGLIGRMLCQDLLRLGAVVTCIGRDEKPASVAPEVSWIKSDLIQGVQPALPEHDVLIHAASFRRNARFHREQAEEVKRRNIEMTERLLAAVSKPPARALLFSTGNIPWNPATQEHSDGYVAGKQACEELWLQWAQGNSVSLAIVRPANVYGPGDSVGPEANVIPALMWRLLQGESPLHVQAPAELARPFLFVRDASAAAIAMLEHASIEPLLSYVRPPRERTLSDVVTILQRLCGTTVPVEFAQSATQANQLSYGPVLPFLANMTWTSLEDGLAETVASWRSLA